ncbi:MAG: hypothetical protein M5R36_14870 [Deltaproteobacteria bacterium]|nr:hypothetical protein [Deltaproteobacteria bacterium]
MRLFLFLLAILTCWLMACGNGDDDDDDDPTAAEQCIEKYSPENGYDWETIPPGLSYGDDDDDDDDVSMREHAEEQCRANGGEYCESDDFITSRAALCIAQDHGYMGNTDVWDVWMVFHYGYKTVIWATQNLLGEKFLCGDSRGANIHATTGEVLGEMDMGAICDP